MMRYTMFFLLYFVGASSLFSQADCEGLVVYDYGKVTDRNFSRRFRKILIGELSCDVGKVIDHTKSASLIDAGDKERVLNNLKIKYPDRKRVLFLEYEERPNKDGSFTIWGQLMTFQGEVESLKRKNFFKYNINENIERGNAQIRIFIDDIFNPRRQEIKYGFSSGNKFKILVLNFDEVDNCPALVRNSSERTFQDALNISLPSEKIEVLIDNFKPVTTRDVAVARGEAVDADMVVWSNEYIHECDGGKARFRYELLYDIGLGFLKRSGASELGSDLTTQRKLIRRDIQRLFFWSLAVKKYYGSEYAEANRLLKEIEDGTISDQEEYAEKYFMLGQSVFDVNMNRITFESCSNYFNTSINGNGDLLRRGYWINLLYLLMDNPKIEKVVKSELVTQGALYLDGKTKQGVKDENELSFCLNLSMAIDNYNYIEKIVSGPGGISAKTLSLLVDVYDRKGEDFLAIKNARALLKFSEGREKASLFLCRKSMDKANWKEAKSYLTVNFVEDDNIRMAYYFRAYLAMKEGDKKECLEYYGYYLSAKGEPLDEINRYLKLEKGEADKDFNLPVQKSPKSPKSPKVGGECEIRYSLKNNQKFSSALGFFYKNVSPDVANKIKLLNSRIKPDDYLQSSTVLLIHDGVEVFSYVVNRGDILADIVGRYKIIINDLTVEGVKRLNGLRSVNDICAGQRLILMKGCESDIRDLGKALTLQEAANQLGLSEKVLEKENGRVDGKCPKSIWIVKR